MTTLEWLVDKHKGLIVKTQKTFKLTDYGLLWFVFFKGFILALVLKYYFFIDTFLPVIDSFIDIKKETDCLVWKSPS